MEFIFENLYSMFERIMNEDCGGDCGGGDCGAAVGGDSASVAGDSVSGSDGMSTNVIGNCTNHHANGFFGPGCFHTPSNVAVPYTRFGGCCYGGSKRKNKKNKKKPQVIDVNKVTVCKI